MKHFTIHVQAGTVSGAFAAHQEPAKGFLTITIDESALAGLPPKTRHLRLRQIVTSEVIQAVVKMLDRERRP